MSQAPVAHNPAALFRLGLFRLPRVQAAMKTGCLKGIEKEKGTPEAGRRQAVPGRDGRIFHSQIKKI